jgi:hypothetical protein
MDNMTPNKNLEDDMRAQKNAYGDWIVTEGADRYNETRQAEPTSRLLDGSRDHGYAAEYVGYGDIDGIPIRAVYLLNDEDMQDAGGEGYEDAGDFDWDLAMEQGRLVVIEDELTDEQYETLKTTGVL